MVVKESEMVTVDAPPRKQHPQQQQRKGKTISRDKVSKLIAMVQARSNHSTTGSKHKKNAVESGRGSPSKPKKKSSFKLKVTTSPEDKSSSSGSSGSNKDQYNHPSPIRSPLQKVQSSSSPAAKETATAEKTSFHFTSFSTGGTDASNDAKYEQQQSAYAAAINQENVPTPRARSSSSSFNKPNNAFLPQSVVSQQHDEATASSLTTDNSASHKSGKVSFWDEVDSTYNSSNNDIEKDIEVTSLTLAKISHYIDTVAPPKEKKEKKQDNNTAASYPKADEVESREPQETKEEWSLTNELKKTWQKKDASKRFGDVRDDDETITTYEPNDKSKGSVLNPPENSISAFEALFDIAMKDDFDKEPVGYHVSYGSKKNWKNKGDSADEPRFYPYMQRTSTQDPPDTRSLPQSSSSSQSTTKKPVEGESSSVLSKISAFIDQVENQQDSGDQEVTTDSFFEALGHSSLTQEFDSETLNSIFGPSNTPKSKRTFSSKSVEKALDHVSPKNRRNEDEDRQNALESVPSEGTMAELPSLCSSKDTWAEMERIVNEMSERQANISRTNTINSETSHEVEMNQSKEHDPICQIRGDDEEYDSTSLEKFENEHLTEEHTVRKQEDPPAELMLDDPYTRVRRDPPAERVCSDEYNSDQECNEEEGSTSSLEAVAPQRNAKVRGGPPRPEREFEHEKNLSKASIEDSSASDGIGTEIVPIKVEDSIVCCASDNTNDDDDDNEPYVVDLTEVSSEEIMMQGFKNRYINSEVRTADKEASMDESEKSLEVQVVHQKEYKDPIQAPTKDEEVVLLVESEENVPEQKFSDSGPSEEKRITNEVIIDPAGISDKEKMDQIEPAVENEPTVEDTSEDGGSDQVEQVFYDEATVEETPEKEESDRAEQVFDDAAMVEKTDSDHAADKDSENSMDKENMNRTSEKEESDKAEQVFNDETVVEGTNRGRTADKDSKNSMDNENMTESPVVEEAEAGSENKKIIASEDGSAFERVLSNVSDQKGREPKESDNRSTPGQIEEDYSEKEEVDYFKGDDTASQGTQPRKEEEDRDPLQTLLFARHGQASGIEYERKGVGLSLVLLTLDEVKKFAESQCGEKDTALSKEKLEMLEQLDRTFSIPSILTDLAEVDASLSMIDQLQPDMTTSEEDAGTVSKNLLMEIINKRKQGQRSHDIQESVDQTTTTKEPIYTFQSTNQTTEDEESNANRKTLELLDLSTVITDQAKREDTLVIEGQDYTLVAEGQDCSSLASMSTASKKRNFPAEEQPTKQNSSEDKRASINWFSLDHILSLTPKGQSKAIQDTKLPEITGKSLIETSTEIDYVCSDASMEADPNTTIPSTINEKKTEGPVHSVTDVEHPEKKLAEGESQAVPQAEKNNCIKISSRNEPINENIGCEGNVELRQDSHGFVAFVENSFGHDEEAIILAISSSSSEEEDDDETDDQAYGTRKYTPANTVTEPCKEEYAEFSNSLEEKSTGVKFQPSNSDTMHESASNNNGVQAQDDITQKQEFTMIGTDFAEFFLEQNTVSDVADCDSVPEEDAAKEQSMQWKELKGDIDSDTQENLDKDSNGPTENQVICNSEQANLGKSDSLDEEVADYDSVPEEDAAKEQSMQWKELKGDIDSDTQENLDKDSNGPTENQVIYDSDQANLGKSDSFDEEVADYDSAPEDAAKEQSVQWKELKVEIDSDTQENLDKDSHGRVENNQAVYNLGKSDSLDEEVADYDSAPEEDAAKEQSVQWKELKVEIDSDAQENLDEDSNGPAENQVIYDSDQANLGKSDYLGKEICISHSPKASPDSNIEVPAKPSPNMFIDIADLEEEEDEASEDPVDLAELEKEWVNKSNSNTEAAKHPGKVTIQLPEESPTPIQSQGKEDNVAPFGTAKSIDQTPRMHRSKHFDFIEEVDESENAEAFISRMATLKKGGHLPNLNTDVLGSFIKEKLREEDADAIEVDLDVGFVQKSLAPIFSDEHGTWDELDSNHNSYDASVEGRDRYACKQHSASSLEEENAGLESASSTHFHAPGRNSRDDLSQNGGTSLSEQNASGSLHIPSSKTSSSFADRDDETYTYSSKVPLPLISSSMNGSENGHVSARSREEETNAFDDEALDEFPVNNHQQYVPYKEGSYDSDHNEWMRKRDFATRKTQDPNSWITRTTSNISNKFSFVTGEAPMTINGVDAAKRLSIKTLKTRASRHRIPGTNAWKLSYKDRCKDHPGYFDVDYYSLFESSDVSRTQPHPFDFAPWELRDVRQHFLQDHSLSFSKNWFGKFQRARGNQRIREPVAHPRSMEMPMENNPHPEEWTEEWYKVWKAPNRTNSSLDSCSYSDSEDFDSRSGGSRSIPDDSSSYMGKSSSHSDSEYGSYADEAASSRSEYGISDNDYEDSMDEDDAPQCGELINVKPKIGERVTRIHPDFTCSLRRSRWRKKYFPRGTFPYDK